MRESKISIIVPAYNCQLYIKECLDSLLSQTYDNLEIIVVNDGSSDNTRSICEEYSVKNSSIYLINQENKGEAGARNTGLSQASGEFIAFVDSDDYIDSNMIELLYNAIKSSKADLAVSSISRFPNPKLIKNSSEINTPLNAFYFFNNLLNKDEFLSCWRCLFHINIIKNNKILFTNGRKIGADQEFVYKYLLHSKAVVNIPNAVYYYRENPSSMMLNKTYIHFHIVDAMQSVIDYAYQVVEAEEAEKIAQVIKNNICIHGIYFASVTLLTAGERVASLKQFLFDKGYNSFLKNAVVNKNKSYYQFWKLWNMSPTLCLYYYSFRKKIGNLMRKLK